MNIMTLNLISSRVHYHFFPSGRFEAQWSGCMQHAHGFEEWRTGLAELKQRTQNSGHTTQAIGVRLVHYIQERGQDARAPRLNYFGLVPKRP